LPQAKVPDLSEYNLKQKRLENALSGRTSSKCEALRSNLSTAKKKEKQKKIKL
jgi:hypothetical protein